MSARSANKPVAADWRLVKMKVRWKWLVALLLATVGLLGVVSIIWITGADGPKKPAYIPQGDYTYARALAEDRLHRVMKQWHVPGVAAVIIDDQEIVWQASLGWANVEEEIAIDDNTVFKLWSLAKPFTALEIMRLVEEGRLDLDAALSAYVPDFSIQSRFSGNEPITLRHILAHRAGLPRNACHYGFGWETGPAAIETLAVALEDCFLAYPTGERYKYSNIGYDALGYIIQAERGRAFPAYMRDGLLLPMGMTHSAFYSTDLPAGSEIALGYEFYEGAYYPHEQEDIGAIPSGNLYATADDLATFVKFFFRDGEAEGRQLVSPETLADMLEDQYSRPADPQRVGLGWKLGYVADSELVAWHDGGPSEGTGSLIAMLPERKLGVVLLGNATTFDGSVSLPIAVEMLEVLLETRDGLIVVEKDEPAEEIRVDAVELEQYAGSYAAFGDILEVTVDGDQLQGATQGMRFDLVSIAKNRFRVSHWLLGLGLVDLLQLPMDLNKLEIAFQSDEKYVVDSMVIDFGGFNYEVCPRYPALPEEGSWKALAGRYEIFGRLPSGQPYGQRLGESTIFVEKDQIFMSGAVGPILPVDDNTIIILGGAYHGETITRDPQTGVLTHQGLMFKPLALATE